MSIMGMNESYSNPADIGRLRGESGTGSMSQQSSVKSSGSVSVPSASFRLCSSRRF